jgi:sugar phosphate isomerase/epimerase
MPTNHNANQADLSRRGLLRAGLFGGVALATAGIAHAAQEGSAKPATQPATPAAPAAAAPLFLISLAQWSLHKTLYANTLDHLDFPKFSKEQFGIDAVEYVSTFFKQKSDAAYNAELRKRCDGHGVKSILIMVDGEGALGDPDDAKRAKAVENHRPWLDAAKALGCHSIRVNAESKGSPDEQQRLAADGLRRLCEAADPYGLNVIVENHWGLSSKADWLVSVMQRIDHPRAGTLPDFGNFDPKEQDRYDGVQKMMPFAKGVSAKSYAFDPATGDETKINYRRMLQIVTDAGYHDHIGIEYEGDTLPEPEGIRATKRLLERLRDELRTPRKSP